MNIYQKVNEVRKAIGYVKKDKSVSTGGGSYKAVTHDQVIGMVRGSLIEQGIVIVADTTEATFHPKEPDTKQRLYEATYSVHFVNVENPEDRISMTMNAHALDNGDKAPGKAISYATKYAILKLFAIETGEDEESRYQSEPFDVQPLVDSIHAAATLDSLRGAFQAAYTVAHQSGDRAAMKEVMSAKDARKKALEKGAGND